MPTESLPYVRVHPRDLYCQMVTLSNEQAGAYIRLFCMAWLGDPQGTLPDDDDALASIAGVHGLAWQSMKPKVLSQFFTLKAGRWHHEHMRNEYRKAVAYKELQSGKAKKRWHGSGTCRGIEPAHAEPMPPSPSPSPSPSKTSARALSSPGEKKDLGWDDPELLKDPAMRSAIEAMQATKRRNAEAIARQNGARP